MYLSVFQPTRRENEWFSRSHLLQEQGLQHQAQRVHVGIWYILRAQRGSHIPTLRPKYIPYTYMDPLGGTSPECPGRSKLPARCGLCKPSRIDRGRFDTRRLEGQGQRPLWAESGWNPSSPGSKSLSLYESAFLVLDRVPGETDQLKDVLIHAHPDALAQYRNTVYTDYIGIAFINSLRRTCRMVQSSRRSTGPMDTGLGFRVYWELRAD